MYKPTEGFFLCTPEPPQHNGCAAKIAFSLSEAAAKFFKNTRGGFFIEAPLLSLNRTLTGKGSRCCTGSTPCMVGGNQMLTG